MKHLRNHVLILSALMLVSALAPSPAHANTPPPDEALIQANRMALDAQDLFRRGEFRRAGRLFQEANQLRADEMLLFNAALSFERAGDLALAERLYFEYTQLATSESGRKALALAYLDRRRETPQAGHDRSATPGATPEASPSPKLTYQTSPTRSRGPSAWGWVSSGLGLAVLASGLGLRVHSSNLRQDVLDAQTQAVDGLVPRDALTQREAAAKDSRAKRANRWGAAGLVVGGAALTGGIITLLVTRGRPNASSRSQVGLVPARGGAGMTFGGEF